MLNGSFSDWLDLSSTNELKEQLERAFDILELSNVPCKLDKDGYISELLEKKFTDSYSSALDFAYEEFKNEGFRG